MLEGKAFELARQHRMERNEIKGLVYKALLEANKDYAYHNLVIALQEIATEMAYDHLKSEVLEETKEK